MFIFLKLEDHGLACDVLLHGVIRFSFQSKRLKAVTGLDRESAHLLQLKYQKGKLLYSYKPRCHRKVIPLCSNQKTGYHAYARGYPISDT